MKPVACNKRLCLIVSLQDLEDNYDHKVSYFAKIS